MGSETTSRRADLDWLRVFACYLLIPFHVAMVFNPAPFYHVRNDELGTAFLIFCGFVSLWHMPLLFLLAGWSAFRSLRARGTALFLSERVSKLLVPLLAGCVLLAPGIKYLELRGGQDLYFDGLRVSEGLQESFRAVLPGGLPVAAPFRESFLEFLPTFFTQLDRFSWSHLWFLAYLLAFTGLALPLLGRLARGGALQRRVARGWVYAPLVPLLLIQLALRERWPGPYNLVADWANFSYFATFFVAGILLAREPALDAAIESERRPALVIALVTLGVLLALLLGVARAPVLLLVGAAVAGWCCIVALLGFVHAAKPRGGPALDRLAESAFPVYLLHQPVIVFLAAAIVKLPLGMTLKFLLLLVASLGGTLGVYWLLVRPFALSRFLCGMKRLPQADFRRLREDAPALGAGRS